MTRNSSIRKMQGICLLETLMLLFVASALLLILVHAKISMTSEPPAFITTILTGYAVLIIGGLVYNHDVFITTLSSKLIPNHKKLVEYIESEMPKHLIPAMPYRAITCGSDLNVVLFLKRGFSVSIASASVVYPSPFQLNTHFQEEFENVELEKAQAFLQSEIQNFMGPWLSPLAAYCWPERSIRCTIDLSSNHKIIAALAMRNDKTPLAALQKSSPRP